MAAYPLLSLLAAVAVVAVELRWLRTGVLRRPAYWIAMAITFAFMVPVDGFMSRVPNGIVIYDPAALSGLRFPIDIPIEEFVYAFAMVTLAIVLWERAGGVRHPGTEPERRPTRARPRERTGGFPMGALSKYIRVEAPAQQVYELWRDPSNFPDFMEDVKEVEARGDRWHWKVDGPVTDVEWDSEVIEDVPGQKIAWKSVAGLENAGAVRFDDRGDATDVEFSMEFSPPGGKAGDVVAKIFDDPERKLQLALEAFKALVERDAKPRVDARTHVDAEEASPSGGAVA